MTLDELKAFEAEASARHEQARKWFASIKRRFRRWGYDMQPVAPKSYSSFSHKLPSNASAAELLTFVERLATGAERDRQQLAAIQALIAEEQRRYLSAQ